MSSGEEKGQKRRFILGIAGLGLIFTALWAALLVFMPPGQISTIINYVMYFMSLFVIAFPTNNVLGLYVRKSVYTKLLSAIIWLIWVFGVRMLFVWVISELTGR